MKIKSHCLNNMEERKYYLHPLSILIFIIISSILVFISNDIVYIMLIAIGFFIELLMKRDKFLKSIILAFIAYLVIRSQILYNLGMWGGSLHTIIFVFYRLVPVFILSIAMTGFTSTELMSAYRNVGLEERFCLAIAIFFRFLPDFKKRMIEIREGAKLRGIKISILHPLRSFEIFLVPMLYKVLSLSDSLTAAIITKGVEYKGEKTNYRNIRFSIYDGLLIIIGIILIGVTIWLKI